MTLTMRSSLATIRLLISFIRRRETLGFIQDENIWYNLIQELNY